MGLVDDAELIDIATIRIDNRSIRKFVIRRLETKEAKYLQKTLEDVNVNTQSK